MLAKGAQAARHACADGLGRRVESIGGLVVAEVVEDAQPDGVLLCVGQVGERLGVLDAAGTASAEPADSWLDGIDEALAHLPDAQQDAIRLRVLDDLGYDEAADRLDTTPQAVRARVSRGLSALRKHFSTSTEMIR